MKRGLPPPQGGEGGFSCPHGDSMPYLSICHACNYKIASEDRDTIDTFMGLHYRNSHEHEFNACVFSDSPEFLGLDFHLKKKELVIHVLRINKSTFDELRLASELKISPTKIM